MRIRAVKPEFWSSPNHPADPWARLLYIAMWNWADDAGVGTANLRELAGFAFPNDDQIDVGAMRRMCADISAHYGAQFYTVAGRPYYAVVTWRRHQKFDSRREGRNPGPDQAEEWLYQAERTESAQCADGAPTSARTSGAGTGEIGTGEQSSLSEPDGSDEERDETVREDVERVCRHLRDRIIANGSKPPVITKAWRRSARLLIDKDHRTVDQILAAIDWCQNDDFWRGNIMSMPKLRDKYDQLRLKAMESKPTSRTHPTRIIHSDGKGGMAWEM